ncbi:CorA family divalent cation transporter [Saccharopolyspora sp. NPDC000995]
MSICAVSHGVLEHRPLDELDALLHRQDVLVWVDLAATDADTEHVLSDVFGFHPLAVRDCLERTYVPKVHVYGDHVFVTLHAR